MYRTSIESLYHQYPELEPFKTEIGEPTRFGEALTIVGHPFGHPVDNRDLLQMAIDHGLPQKEADTAEKVIARTGFTNRYFSRFATEELDINHTVDRASTVGAILLKETLAANGWEDGIDVFIDTSAFLPVEVGVTTLEKAGLNPSNILHRSYRYACAGAVGAFIDCLSDPSLQDARIVIAALEPLSQLVQDNHLQSVEKLVIPSIFGDANTLLAFNPKHFHLENKRVLVQPDGGVIKLQTLYDFPQTPSSPTAIPDYYRFANQGEGIFHYSSSGAFLDIPHPQDGSTASMDGMATGFFFGDQTTEVIVDLLTENGNFNLLKQLGDQNIILHPASKPVVDRIAKLLKRSPQRLLDTAELPFLMDKARHSNSSSATTFNRWRYMIQNNMVDPQKPFLWIAPGIGSAIAGAIGWIHP